MHAASSFEPAQGFVDPRTADGFQPHLWPSRTGEDAPAVGATDRHDRRCIEFLTAYYHVNCRHEELIDARNKNASEDEIAARLRSVADAVQAVDDLEDRYAPIGFYGEPAMDGAYYRSIGFNRPELPRILSEQSVESSHIAIPGLDGIPFGELRGPVIVTRWTHGKVDL
jgi:hypothetical protein